MDLLGHEKNETTETELVLLHRKYILTKHQCEELQNVLDVNHNYAKKVVLLVN
jgi:hypothetical protein